MPYRSGWYIPHQVIDAYAWGDVTLDDMDLAMATSVQLLMEAQTHAPGNTIHLLLDTLEARSIPPIYHLIKPGTRVLKFDNRGTVFLITRNAAIRSVIEVTAHLAREHYPLRVFKERQTALDALVAYLANDGLR